MTAVAYVRRSAKSDPAAVSVATQLDTIRAYAGSHGLSIGAVITHDGVSGTKRKRFYDIEEAIKKCDAKSLLIYHRDRLARDVAGLMDLLRDLSARGIEVRDVTTGQVLSVRGSQNFLTTGVAGIFDEYYPRLVSEKTLAALAFKRSRGERYSHHAPLGYRYEDGKMIEDAEEQRALKIIEECRTRHFGRVRTLEALRAAGYNGRGGLSTIQRLLKGLEVTPA